MLPIIRTSGLLGLATLLLSTSVQAEELSLWQVPQKDIPVFYREASQSSKTSSKFKAGQTLSILSHKKGWVQLAALDKSGETAWISQEAAKPLIPLNITIKQNGNSYDYQATIGTPDAQEGSYWYTRKSVSSGNAVDHKDGVELQEFFEKLNQSSAELEKRSIQMMQEWMQHMKPVIEGCMKQVEQAVANSEKKLTELSQTASQKVTESKKAVKGAEEKQA
jgi:hypothetical protein